MTELVHGASAVPPAAAAAPAAAAPKLKLGALTALVVSALIAAGIFSLAAKRDYLTSVYQKIYLGDIAARHSIENTFALRILFRKLAESIKQPVSFTRITDSYTKYCG